MAAGPGCDAVATAVDSFSRFADLITQRWASDGTKWVTFNDPLVFFKHEMTIGRVGPSDFPRSLDNAVTAHRLGYEAARARIRRRWSP